ncbi:hypothetical protein ACWEFD_17165 [Streptomyces ardesiacus]
MTTKGTAPEENSEVRTVDNAGARTMKRLTNRIVRGLQSQGSEQDFIPALGNALSQVRGREVRLRASTFPPEARASGLWVKARGHDLIVYEENTHPMHQQVIIGHEAWHMFAGHCGSPTAHGVSGARAGGSRAAALLDELARRVTELEAVETPATEHMDVGVHIAALRAESAVPHEEEAEVFGYVLRTAIHSYLEDARITADLHGIAGRIQVSMAHRGHRT